MKREREREKREKYLNRLLQEQHTLMRETVGLLREVREYLDGLQRAISSPRATLMQQRGRDDIN